MSLTTASTAKSMPRFRSIGFVWLDPIPWGLSMPQIVAIGYIAITVSDLEATCTFYDELFGSERIWSLLPKGKVQVRYLARAIGFNMQT